jgi:hypothetical protein
MDDKLLVRIPGGQYRERSRTVIPSLDSLAVTLTDASTGDEKETARLRRSTRATLARRARASRDHHTLLCRPVGVHALQAERVVRPEPSERVFTAACASLRDDPENPLVSSHTREVKIASYPRRMRNARGLLSGTSATTYPYYNWANFYGTTTTNIAPTIADSTVATSTAVHTSSASVRLPDTNAVVSEFNPTTATSNGPFTSPTDAAEVLAPADSFTARMQTIDVTPDRTIHVAASHGIINNIGIAVAALNEQYSMRRVIAPVNRMVSDEPDHLNSLPSRAIRYDWCNQNPDRLPAYSAPVDHQRTLIACLRQNMRVLDRWISATEADIGRDHNNLAPASDDIFHASIRARPLQAPNNISVGNISLQGAMRQVADNLFTASERLSVGSAPLELKDRVYVGPSQATALDELKNSVAAAEQLTDQGTNICYTQMTCTSADRKQYTLPTYISAHNHGAYPGRTDLRQGNTSLLRLNLPSVTQAIINYIPDADPAINSVVASRSMFPVRRVDDAGNNPARSTIGNTQVVRSFLRYRDYDPVNLDAVAPHAPNDA